MKISSSSLFLIPLMLAAAVRAADEAPRDERKIAIYNFSQLVDKAERIVFAELGERKDGRLTLKTLETFKAPTRDPADVSPEMIKQAEELLRKPAKPKTEIKEGPIVLLVNDEMKLPAAGEQAIFFLWDAQKDENGTAPVYAVKHPQCIYDADLLPQVRAGIFKPRSISDGRFLRSWDQSAALKLAQRKADEELRKLPSGEAVQGIKMDCVRPRLAIRGDGSFLIASHLSNVFGREQQVYDGPAGSYGAIIRPKGGPIEKGLILRLGGFDGIDPAALNITSMLDFESIEAGQLLSREHTFDVKNFPILKTLNGPYLIKMFYSNTHDGMIKGRPRESLESPAWTGTVVSKEIEFEFKSAK